MDQNDHIVFVIGAGASEEAGLPIGSELKEKIARLLDYHMLDHSESLKNGDRLILSALRLSERGRPDVNYIDINIYLHAAWKIRDAMPLAASIDNYIDQHYTNKAIALCGKLAIVRAILAEEKGSNLYFDKSYIKSSIDFVDLEKKGTWYIPFFQMLTKHCRVNELKERFKHITLIIFNYDRCVEHFIYHALRKYYDELSDTEAAELVKIINIHHTYGHVGTLPWWNLNNSMEFGAEPNAAQLLQLALGINTFSEGSNRRIETRTSMSKATKVVFLGFAFDESNMEEISPKRISRKSKPSCFATTHGFSDYDKMIIEEQIQGLYSGSCGQVNMQDLECSEFFNEFKKSLAF